MRCPCPSRHLTCCFACTGLLGCHPGWCRILKLPHLGSCLCVLVCQGMLGQHRRRLLHAKQWTRPWQISLCAPNGGCCRHACSSPFAVYAGIVLKMTSWQWRRSWGSPACCILSICRSVVHEGGRPWWNTQLCVGRDRLRPLFTFRTNSAPHGVARTPCKLSTIYPAVHAWSWAGQSAVPFWAVSLAVSSVRAPFCCWRAGTAVLQATDTGRCCCRLWQMIWQKRATPVPSPLLLISPLS